MWVEPGGTFLTQSGKAEVPLHFRFSNTVSLTLDTLASGNYNYCLDSWEVEREQES